ncbi:hypothetical protein DBIPINDM_004813 [Mesorhizobium sp. AR02]|uniref:hypothetical protein n=1 Tax=Mesorhizobium sp. AR02 TaxID=2865837 RepID=UPI00215FC023|nr:hypothetical protein [Mesorhizobium sp. AR02]UVK51535.1 hypothetical protein DBIPINDM_004813 [Mesorhizobium sp. AR02]
MTVLPTKPPHGHKKREYRKTNDRNDRYHDDRKRAAQNQRERNSKGFSDPFH